MALKEGKTNREIAERNKATLAKLHQIPGFTEKIQEGYAQIERGEYVTVTTEDTRSRSHSVG